MSEPNNSAPRGQLMADASTDPVKTLEEFLAIASTEPLPNNPPEGALQVYRDAQERLEGQCRFFHVASDYYDWPYEQRARVMGCPSSFHLCKTLIFENTKYEQDPSKAIDEYRYWCVVVQYEGASANVTKLEKAAREITGASRKKMHLRIAPSEKSFELTGYTNNAVSPIGMKTDLPIFISTAISELSPQVFYLGAGHIDWKVAVPFQGFVEKWNARVVDFS